MCCKITVLYSCPMGFFKSNVYLKLLILIIYAHVCESLFLPHQRAGQGELKLAEVTAELAAERDNRGMTPLMWAAAYGQTPTVSRLLQVKIYQKLQFSVVANYFYPVISSSSFSTATRTSTRPRTRPRPRCISRRRTAITTLSGFYSIRYLQAQRCLFALLRRTVKGSTSNFLDFFSYF
jgi:hypothetical protein